MTYENKLLHFIKKCKLYHISHLQKNLGVNINTQDDVYIKIKELKLDCKQE